MSKCIRHMASRTMLSLAKTTFNDLFMGHCWECDIWCSVWRHLPLAACRLPHAACHIACMHNKCIIVALELLMPTVATPSPCPCPCPTHSVSCPKAGYLFVRASLFNATKTNQLPNCPRLLYPRRDVH